MKIIVFFTINSAKFLISTDQPDGLFTDKIASFYIVDNSLGNILYKMDLETDGDLEGISYIGHGEVIIISEIGTVYSLKENENK